MKRDIAALTELRRVCVNAPEHLFHMTNFVQEAPCGTARCLLGWAAIDPYFQRDVDPIVSAGGKVKPFVNWLRTQNNVARHLGIGGKESALLFAGIICIYDDGHSVSKEEVLWNIDELIAGREVLPYEAVAANYPAYSLVAGGGDNPHYEPDDDEG